MGDICGIGARDQKPAAPLLPNEELRQRVGQHVQTRRNVRDVGAAVLLAQADLLRADIQQQHRLAACRISNRQQRLGPCIRQDKADAIPGNLVDERFRIPAFGKRIWLQREGLLGESAGGVVVVDGELRAAQASIGRQDREARDRQ
jgi:hypothetical protein